MFAAIHFVLSQYCARTLNLPFSHSICDLCNYNFQLLNTAYHREKLLLSFKRDTNFKSRERITLAPLFKERTTNLANQRLSPEGAQALVLH